MNRRLLDQVQLAMNLIQEEASCGPSSECSPETELPPREDNGRNKAASTESDSTLLQNSDIQSWCPGGAIESGICRPARNQRPDWMSRYEGCHALPIGECILLGTHNSGMDKLSPLPGSSDTCQDVPVLPQLVWGARVLDLRIQFFPNAEVDKRFGLFHGTWNGRYLETEVLDALLTYRLMFGAPNEIVILDFHVFKNFTAAAHRELAALLKTKFGSSIVPRACKEAAIVQLWEMRMNTIIAYNHEGGYDDLFWPGVNQRWIGRNTPSKGEMKAFIEEVGREPKAFGALRSVQAAYYSLPMFTPKDLSEDLMNWFAATEEGGPISNHYIISTDWSFRQRLADNVIYANGIRSQARGAYVMRLNTQSSRGWVETSAYSIYILDDRDFFDTIKFLPNKSQSTSIVLVMNHSNYESQLVWSPNAPARTLKTGTRVLLRVAPQATPELIWDNGI